MIINSGYRCPEYNDRVAKTGRNGPHTTGFAFDIKVSGSDALDFVRCALEEKVTGLGIAQRGAFQSRFIHIDWLDYPEFPRKSIWSY